MNIGQGSRNERQVETTGVLPVKDLTGQTFGRLRVLGVEWKPSVNGPVRCQRCVCECGAVVLRKAYELERGIVVSCGCWKREGKHVGKGAAHPNYRHGSHRNKLYRTWRGILNRCYDPKVKAYPDYGGRGIRVCEAWRVSFDTFCRDVGDPPSDGRGWGIDRIQNDGDYAPGNVRWATQATQSLNRRNNVWLEAQGRRMTLSQWARDRGLSAGTIQARMRRGWSIEQALFTPKGAGHER